MTRFPSIRLTTLLGTLAVCLLASNAAQAACYADYSARMDNPLRLHYGVIELPDSACEIEAAEPVIADRLSAQGWILMSVRSVFDDTGLASRRSDAGQFYLSF